MKTLKFIAVILVLGFFAASCEGPEGPKGNNGTNGVDGIDGTDGTDGNANVACYGFGSVTFTSASNYNSFMLPISSAMVDSSMIFSYYYTSGGWYTVGQLGPFGDYLSRCWLYGGTTSSELGVRVHNPDGSSFSGSDAVWDSVRVFVVPANSFHMAEQQNLNFANYNEVSGYFSK